MSKIDSILEAPEKNAESASNAILETPPLVVLWMITLIPERYFISDKTTFFDPACGKGTFLKYIYFKLRQYGHSHQNAIGRIFGIDKYSPANETSDIFPNIIKKDFLKMEFPKSWPKSFNISLSNPPYKGLDISFLERCLDITTDHIVFVHPSTIYINKKSDVLGKQEEKIIKKISPFISELSLFNGNKVFGIKAKYPLSVVSLDLRKEGNSFLFRDRFKGKDFTLNSISELSIFGYDLGFNKFRNKLVDILKSNQSIWSISSLNPKNTVEGKFFVKTGPMAGNNEYNREETVFKDDFFVIINKPNLKVLNSKPSKKTDIYWGFETRKEAENFIKYVSSFFSRACLSTVKFNQNLHRGELEAIPLIDFKNKFSDEEIYSNFKIDQEMILSIRANIPKYL